VPVHHFENFVSRWQDPLDKHPPTAENISLCFIWPPSSLERVCFWINSFTKSDLASYPQQLFFGRGYCYSWRQKDKHPNGCSSNNKPLLEFGKWKDLTIIQTLFQYYMTDINNYDNISLFCVWILHSVWADRLLSLSVLLPPDFYDNLSKWLHAGS